MAAEVAVGIDLGTHATRLAVMTQDRPQLVADAAGETQHASVVSFLPDDSVVVGNAARGMLTSAPDTTVYGTKRLLGRFFFSEEVKRARVKVPFKLVEGPGGVVQIAVRDQTYGVPEVTSLLLRQLRALAEESLGTSVARAVITVPAHFQQAQRDSMRRAVELAGFETLDMLEEPNAAALAVGLTGQAAKLAIFEMGGTSTAVTMAELGPAGLKVLSSARDPHLGGEDLDARMASWLADAFAQRHGVDLRAQPAAFSRLTAAAEHAKKVLSIQEQAHMQIPLIHTEATGAALDLDATVTRGAWFPLLRELLQRTFKLCDEALRSAQLTVANVDHVVLVGGATQLPVFATGLRHYFKRPPSAVVDPHSVVAVGAARHASQLLSGNGTPISPRSTGPAATARDAAPPPGLRVRLFQEDPVGGGNRALGETPANITVAPDGQLQVDLVLGVDAGKPHVAGGPALATEPTPEAWARFLRRVEGLNPSILADEVTRVRLAQQEVVQGTAQLEARMAAIHKLADAVEKRRTELQATEAQQQELKELRKLAREMSTEISAGGTARKDLSEERAQAVQVLQQLRVLLEGQGSAVALLQKRVEEAGALAGAVEVAVRANSATVVSLTEQAEKQRTAAQEAHERVGMVMKEIEDLHIRHDELRDKEPVVEAATQKMAEMEQHARRLREQLLDLDRSEARVSALADTVTQADAVRGTVARAQEEALLAQQGLQALLERARGMTQELVDARKGVDEVKSEVYALTQVQARLGQAGAMLEEMKGRMADLQNARANVDAMRERLAAVEDAHDRTLKQQDAWLSRQADLDALAARLERAETQSSTLYTSLQSLQAQHDDMGNVMADARALAADVATAQAAWKEAQLDAQQARTQEARSKAAATAVEEADRALQQQVTRLTALQAELDRGLAQKTQLAADLATAREAQETVAVQLRQVEEQRQGLDQQARALEERAAQLQTATQKLSAAQDTLTTLQTTADGVERRLEGLERRAGALEDLRTALREVTQRYEEAMRMVDAWQARSRDLEAFGVKVKDVLEAATTLDARMKTLASRDAVVKGVEESARMASEMMQEVEERLMWLNEQRALVDMSADKVRALEDAMRAADGVADRLKRERSLAERIDHAIRALREKKEGDA